jgi:ACS family pantothenate transporter-like MFS transporter
LSSFEFQLPARSQLSLPQRHLKLIRYSVIFYPVTDAPNYRKGYIASIVTGALIIPLVLLIAYLEKQGIKNGTLGRNFDTEETGDESLDTGEARPTEVDFPQKI